MGYSVYEDPFLVVQTVGSKKEDDGERRRCQHDGCTTILNRYNPGLYCHRHAEARNVARWREEDERKAARPRTRVRRAAPGKSLGRLPKIVREVEPSDGTEDE